MMQEILAMEADDPMDWDTDRLVQELCTDLRTLELPSRSKRPDPAELEKALRFHEMIGKHIILDLKDEDIKSFLGITKYGQIVWMRDVIRALRMKSKTYPLIRKDYVVDLFSRVPHDAEGSLSNSILPASSRQTPFIPANTPLGSTAPHQNGVDNYNTDPDSPDPKRRKLTDGDRDGTLLDSLNAPMEDWSEGQPGLELAQPGEDTVKTPLVVNSAITIVEVNGKKRKRLAPILMTTEIDVDRSQEFCEVLQPNTELNVPFVGADGRKRIIPFTEPAPRNTQDDVQGNTQPRLFQGESSTVDFTEVTTANPALVQKQNSNTKSSKVAISSEGPGYLGKRGMPVDDIFYSDVAVGEELTIPTPDRRDSPNEISVRPSNIPFARRIYVHNAMKRYLRSQPLEFNRRGEILYAVLPYSTKLKPRFQSSSFTLFRTKTDGTVQASRQNIEFWPEVDPDTKILPNIVGAERFATFIPPGPDMLALNSIGVNNDWDPSNLEKYLYLEGGDEVLPLYGESDTENEFDERTWAEMEKEHNGTIARTMGPSRSPPLSTDEVTSAIEEGIDALVVVWNQKKLPKLEIKGYKIWQKARKRKTWKQDVITAQTHLAEHLRRIVTMRDTFYKQSWTKRSAILKQITIMEIDLFGREEARWMIATLESKRSPDKAPMSAHPPAKTISPCKTPVDDDVEGESLNSESEGASSSHYDSMDDFIASEDSEENELSLADAEASDDSTMSDGSLPTPPSRSPATPQKRKILYQGLRFRHPSESPSKSRSPRPKQEDSAQRNQSSVRLARATEVIELSSDEGPVIDLITPVKAAKPLVTLRYTPPANSASQAITITDDSDSGLNSPKSRPSLHLINTRVEIGKVPVTQWSALGDRRKLLIAIFQNMGKDRRGAIFSLIVNNSEPVEAENHLWVQMTRVMVAAEYNDKTIEGLTKPLAKVVIMIIGLYEIYVTCKYRRYMIRPAPAVTSMLKESQKVWFHKFVEQTREIADLFNHETALVPSSRKMSKKLKASCVDNDETQDEPRVQNSPEKLSLDYDEEDGEPLSAVRRKRSEPSPSTSDNDLTPDDQPLEDSRRKKKKKLVENVEARDLRQQTLYRKAEQEERRKALQLKLALSGGHANDENSGAIIVNDTKSENEGYINMNNIAAPRIKTHQVEGVRFMWNQIVGNDAGMQGCLLAHTMGLGKTMQVITLLVAIAQASASDDATVVSQIPTRLRQSRTIVLCPPSLIDNWIDELLTWAPPNLLGEFSKVDSTVKHMSERVRKINTWYEEGGVLIIGYEMFRIIMTNQGSTSGKAFPDDAHEEIMKQLTEGPNIIIADEAHKMKNSESAISKMARKFKSMSRIALTGSPLANNVVEYHTMIDWVAPNYLGPIAEFREKYVVPIEEGVWSDCSNYARKNSRKMLAVLNKDIAPKVHRADMKVLRNDLPPKKEFVITVALTDLQRKAYSIYVQSMQSAQGVARSKNGEITQQTLWHWLVVLTLLCNHPSCFASKLEERQADAKDEARKATVGTDFEEEQDSTPGEEKIASLPFDETAPLYKSGVSSTLIADAKALFAKDCADITLPELSNKVEVLLKILDASRAIGDKVLVFSQSIPTLNFLENLMKAQGRNFSRLDGKTPMGSRQDKVKEFNMGKTEVYLISTAAGGLGLNLPGANRVVIFDFKFNPIQEEQAVGRAYRIGQKKETFVYRLICGGTFEETVHNKTIFKTQLASQVVDKKTLIANASRKISDFLFEPRAVELQELSEFKGMDPDVLDNVLASDNGYSIRAIVQSESFSRDDNEVLSAEDLKHVDSMADDALLKRTNPKAFEEKQRKRIAQEQAHAQQAYHQAQQANLLRLKQAASKQDQRLNSVNTAQQPSLPSFKSSNPARVLPIHTLASSSVDGQTRTVLGSKLAPSAPNDSLLPIATSSQNIPGNSILTQEVLTKQTPDTILPPTLNKSSTPSQQRGQSPVRGAGTKVRAATPESTMSELEYVSENSPRSAAKQAESSQEDISNSAMFAAMNKKPSVSSLKTPVLKDYRYRRQSRSTAHEESREVRKANEKRKARGTNPPSKSSRPPPAPKVTSSKIPSWAKEQLSSRQNSSHPRNRNKSPRSEGTRARR